MDVPADAVPLCRPTAPARRTLVWAQILLAVLVVLAAVAVGGAVQERIDDRAGEPSGPIRVGPTAAVLLEAVPAPPLPGVTGSAVPARAGGAGAPRTGLVWAEPGLARGAAVADDDDRELVALTGNEGPLAALGMLIVGWTLTAAGGTIGRSRLDQREDDRWATDWAGVEPVWSGRVR